MKQILTPPPVTKHLREFFFFGEISHKCQKYKSKWVFFLIFPILFNNLLNFEKRIWNSKGQTFLVSVFYILDQHFFISAKFCQNAKIIIIIIREYSVTLFSIFSLNGHISRNKLEIFSPYLECDFLRLVAFFFKLVFFII
jgi:hypothetical protein